jgi:hypothetical protein
MQAEQGFPQPPQLPEVPMKVSALRAERDRSVCAECGRSTDPDFPACTLLL